MNSSSAGADHTGYGTPTALVIFDGGRFFKDVAPTAPGESMVEVIFGRQEIIRGHRLGRGQMQRIVRRGVPFLQFCREPLNRVGQGNVRCRDGEQELHLFTPLGIGI
jgi:hypothetical protein